MRTTIRLLMLVIAMTLVANAAEAGCKIGGKTYPEGTTYSKYICKGGKWVKR